MSEDEGAILKSDLDGIIMEGRVVMKRVLRVIIISFLCILLTRSTKVDAAQEDRFLQSVQEFLCNAVMDDNVYHLSDYQTIQLGNGLTCYAEQVDGSITKLNAKCYGLYNKEEAIGLLCCYNDESGYSFSYSEELAKELTETNGKVAIVFTPTSTTIVEEKGILFDVRRDRITEFTKATPNFQNITIELTVHQWPQTVHGMLTAPSSYSLGVPLEGQGENTPHCWAASTAAVLNYYHPGSYSCLSIVSATGIYNGATMGQTRSFILGEGYTPSSIQTSNYLTVNTLMNRIYGGTPILSGFYNNSNQDHMFVIRGYSSSSSALYLKLMDPKGNLGSGSYVSVSITNASGMQFNYSSYHWHLGTWISVAM